MTSADPNARRIKGSDILLFAALGEETKHRILRTLLDGERCACEIPRRIGRTQPNTSMHLTKLVAWGIIASRRSGRYLHYRIKDQRVRRAFSLLAEEEGNARRR
jgi:ArsR family transcriptional regulator, lead/cadmium/zinc/bismuth-responsive transcriptional repressor